MDNNQIHYKVWGELLINSQASMVQTSILEYVISFHLAHYMWSFTHVGIKANLVWWKRRYPDTSSLKRLINTIFVNDELNE